MLAIRGPPRTKILPVIVYQLYRVRSIDVSHPDAFLFRALAIGKVGEVLSIGRINRLKLIAGRVDIFGASHRGRSFLDGLRQAPKPYSKRGALLYCVLVTGH